MVKVTDKASYKEYRKYVEEFEKELFLPSFPNENEREPFENIVKRITTKSYPQTSILLNIEDGKVLAGCVSDYYPECNAVEPIYLVVREEHRNKGIAREILDILAGGAKHIFLEVDNPERVSGEDSAMDPTVRLEIYKKMGFEVVPIHYVQPPLSKGLDYERNLVLMHRGNSLNKADLQTFLYYFYKGLHAEDSDELLKMLEEISRRGEVV